ncbi:two-component system sensor histidine kinase KdbD [Pectobacterium brasiliense]|uniref:two-component system sensor histidine kinase KdpD n=1 Tax=Pectobacterium brasiliense TaxID=180957 RepID=UPI00196983F7|nr:two-component system sensor histidine kinase KdpD [Pectobacterium brasiliense]MBN3115571.1 two-component system sensor histidine kinase KdbD [Pectobacterium brasiliense]
MIDGEDRRPDPDSLLAQVGAPPRGKLKIFFGACAGVGKTYAMLQEAQRLRAQGLDILVGVVETHGRSETAALLDGLPLLPLKHFRHHGRHTVEFDLDAALARCPALILIDELAHSNVNGSRHPKRWQDVQELLDAGIDVFTTVNVQHLESLNDVVGGVTGIRVRETVPDPIFDQASEVILVDLPPDDLRQRLNEGKVYLPLQAERAVENFFRKGNLIALRELALRRMADRVDDQMRAMRAGKGREQVWHTRDAILLCIGHGTGNEKLVRTAARLAARLGSAWHAVYVETPRLHRLPEPQRRAILRALKLAQDLGAETVTLSEPDEELAVLRYAREHNLGKIVIGRHVEQRFGWWWRTRFAERLGRLGPDLDLVVVAVQDDAPATPIKTPDARGIVEKWRMQLFGCGLATLLCAFITLLASWSPFTMLEPVNLVMIYLLAVVIVALFFGRWPSVFAAVINVASFDLFFILPRGTFAVSDAQYLVTFAVMLGVGLLVGNLTAGVRYQARVARYREQRVRHLYEMSKALNRSLSSADIVEASQHFLSTTFQARIAVLLADSLHHTSPELAQPTRDGQQLIVDRAIARWSFDHRAPAGAGTSTLPGVSYQILPLATTQQIFGVLAIEPNNARQLMIPEQQRLLETFTVLIANALERLHLMQSTENARLDAEREQLRNSLLAALSHDLRTPLTVLFGQAEILTLNLASEGSPYAQQANQIRQHILNTTRLVNNLLDMARIQSDGFNLRKEWQTPEELIGSALQQLESALAKNTIQVNLPDEMVLVYCDAGLMERVFINLLENALKYAGEQATIAISASVIPTSLIAENTASQPDTQESALEIIVQDNGPGIEPGQESMIFDKFSRGHKESSIPGVGLGLAICRAIVEIHGGRIWATNAESGGAAFHFTLPLSAPPDLEPEDIEEH